MSASPSLQTSPGLHAVAPLPDEAPKFPALPYRTAGDFGDGYFGELARAAATIDAGEVDLAAAILVETYTAGRAVFSCGNGGSASVANHLQCDHMKGVRTGTDLAPRVVSLSSNVEIMTAIANDIGYAEVFTFQLESHARAGDALIAISSSGRSPNIVNALSWARDHGLRTIALTGFHGGDARLVADAAIHVECTNYGVVEDLHQATMHFLAQFVRQSRMTADQVATTTF